MSEMPLISSEKAWKNLLENTGKKPGSRLAPNRHIRYTFRGWMQCFILAFFLLVITCIAVKSFQDLIKERVEMGTRDFSGMGLLRLATPPDN